PGGESSFPPRYWEYRGQALHLLGRHEEELAVAREGAGEFPNSPTIARTALRALVALDRLAAVDSVVAVVGTATGSNADLAWTASLELRAHGHVEEALATANSAYEELLEQAPKDGSEAGLEARVRLLYAAERWGEALSVAEKLAEIDPRDPDHLGYLGCAHARLGQRLEAEAVSRRLEALDEAYLRGGHTYNRASIAAVLGHQAEAVRLLQQAHQQGMYLNIWATHLDPDMRPLREFGPFMSFIEPRG
ncbi:MAG: tetratricopeptide repeat protein, partial [Gemmatimonadetes bacterium]|nr:tetratricopeptide repeat protein [Gemmatimonadota bacterium]